jgi:hypothetical protein
VGEGDGGFAETVRGGLNPASCISASLPLEDLEASPEFNLPDPDLMRSLPPLLTLPPVG